MTEIYIREGAVRLQLFVQFSFVISRVSVILHVKSSGVTYPKQPLSERK